jgi:hypothetical protein
VNEISLKTGADRKETLQIVKGFMESVKKLLANEEISIFFFLTFIVECEAYPMICKKNIFKNYSLSELYPIGHKTLRRKCFAAVSWKMKSNSIQFSY